MPEHSTIARELGAELVRQLQVRLTIGKGTMGTAMINALKDVGGAYLVATGGCAVLYAKQVVKVEDVHWLGLGVPEATWVLSVKELGPLIVGIDSEGKSLVQIALDTARGRIEDMCKDEKIDSNRTYVWWPKKIAGTKEHK